MRRHALMECPRKPRSLNRLAAHLLFAAVVWPAVTVIGVVVSLHRLPYYRLPPGSLIGAAFAGVGLAAGDMILAGGTVFGLSWLAFSRLGRAPSGGRWPAARMALEPFLAFVAVISGVSVWYPGVLSEPVFEPVGGLPAMVLAPLLAAGVAAGAAITGRPGARLRLAALLLGAAAASPAAAALTTAAQEASGRDPSLVVLGIDSLSHRDGLASFQNWTEAERGTWYEYAVAPGLLTNAVWTSILTMEPVRAHGVFHTFQPFPQHTAARFLDAARTRGYHTVSMFSDQSTCAVGSQAGFDLDRSGPIGWRQILLPIVANSSILVPVIRPALPTWWPSVFSANQAGSFTYDLRRELRSILGGGVAGRPTLVMAHLTYLHMPAYPRSADLSWAELRRVGRAPARHLRDRGFDWQDVELPTDVLPLRRWKLGFLRRSLEHEIRRSGFLARSGQLVVFSDHGARAGLTPDTFSDPRYHHVLLATFGLPAQRPSEPTSLADIGTIVGLVDSRVEPSVEFTIAPPAMWPELVTSARLRWTGEVELDGGLLAEMSRHLQRHEPWPAIRAAALFKKTADGAIAVQPH